MQLVADRFVVDDRGYAIDLATHDRVHLVSSSAGGAGEQAAWAERCAWFASLVHPSIAGLVDYGTIGESRRFEAWRANPGWRGSNVAADQAAMRACRVLQANRRSSFRGLSVTLGCCGGRPVVIPDDCAGFPSNRTLEGPDDGARDVLGIVREPDRRVASIAEIIAAPATPRMVALAIWAPAEGGIGVAVRLLASSARAAGFVPVCTTALNPAVRELLGGRTLMLLARDDVAGGWRAMLDLALGSAKPHLLIFAGSQPVRRVHVVSLERIPEESLVASVCPEPARRRHLRHVTAAARRAQGLGTRFERLLFGAPPVVQQDTTSRTRSYEDSMTTLSFQNMSAGRAAENASSGSIESTLEPLISDEDGPVARSPERLSEVSSRGWPAPGELARLRRQVESARTLLSAGRYQPGERTARQAMHAFARRGEWAAAAESAVLVARSLMRRGRVQDGSAIVQTARTWADKARDLQLMQELALVEGKARTHQGRLAEAELLLESVHASAISTETGSALDSALALARCLCWQGRWGDAWQRLALVQSDAERSPHGDARLRIVRSRVSIGRHRCAEAVADAARARDTARSLDDRRLLAASLYACAFAQLAAGDAEQADSAARLAADSACQAHDPMLTLRLRLLRAEIARRQGNRAPAALLVRRLGAAHAALLPLTIRARIELLRDLLAASNDAEAAERRAEIAGLPGLRLFAPAPPSSTSLTPAADDIVDLLRCCQVAEEDGAVLAAVCARLRARLRAHAVGFFGIEGDDLVRLVSDGGRIDAATPRRVATANQLVMPHHGGERVEAGVPVRYANQVVGVLAATWTPAAVWHAADVSVLLSTGAAAAGPALSGLVARRAASRHGRMSEMLGVSRSVADVRAAIDRAASAPFAVLIQGESGSGKELVARLLHKLGARRDRPFSALNCAALPDDLVESELFGHARGAFTGALGERRGVFEDAHTGTLFLDEIGELSSRAQAKLLRVVQEGEIRRVGENVCRRVDVRLVTATNRDLHTEAVAGRFRADLLYRLDVIRIALPPLRERSEDVAVLAEHFWQDVTERIGSRATLSAPTIAALARYEWPGNIRELQNVLAALAVRCPKRGAVPPSALPPHIADRSVPASFRLEAARKTFDRGFILEALARCGGQRSRAAEELGVSRQGLAKLMTRLSIEDGE